MLVSDKKSQQLGKKRGMSASLNLKVERGVEKPWLEDGWLKWTTGDKLLPIRAVPILEEGDHLPRHVRLWFRHGHPPLEAEESLIPHDELEEKLI